MQVVSTEIKKPLGGSRILEAAGAKSNNHTLVVGKAVIWMQAESDLLLFYFLFQKLELPFSHLPNQT